MQYLNNVSASVASTMKPAGLENSQGILTAAYLKDPTDKQWDNDAEMKAWREYMTKYMPQANQSDANYIFAYAVAIMMRETLKKCGDLLTRENVMKQAANFQKVRIPRLLPGINVSTSPTDFYPIQAVQMSRFKDDTWDCSATSCRPRAPDAFAQEGSKPEKAAASRRPFCGYPQLRVGRADAYRISVIFLCTVTN